LIVRISAHIYYMIKWDDFDNYRSVCLRILFVSTLLRILYFAMDPLGQSQSIPHVLEQLIFGLGIYFELLAILLADFYWMALHFGWKPPNAKHQVIVRKTKIPFLAIATACFVFEYIYRLLYGLSILDYTVNPAFFFEIVYKVYLVLATLSISIDVMIHGTHLYQKIKNTAEDFDYINNNSHTLQVMLTSYMLDY